MKKIILLAVIAIAAFNSNAQTTTDTLRVQMHNAGLKLIEAEKIQMAGNFSFLIGAGVLAVGEFGEDVKIKKSTLNGVGFTLTGIGFLAHIISWQKVFDAGKQLTIAPDKSGIAISMRF